MSHRHFYAALACAVLVNLLSFPISAAGVTASTGERIRPYSENPSYWQYRGRPVVLLGGSKEDNLFQEPDLEPHLELLADVGGNYIRNTMSARDPGNVQPFARRADGRYDLNRWDEEYWRRFERLLTVSRRLGIIVQIEVWDRFDFSGEQWQINAFNPKHNINYTPAQSGLRENYPEPAETNQQPFFFTTPMQRNNAAVLRYQQRFVDQMLRYALRYPNVLYVIDNETSGDEAWSAYWADYIQQRARRAGVKVFITEMWDDWDMRAPMHRRTFDHPSRYAFVDVSQNTHQRGDTHWQNFQWTREYLAQRGPRPINTVKTYGADTGTKKLTRYESAKQWVKRLIGRAPTADAAGDFGSTDEGIARWWRHLLGGAAGVRFHRPTSGIGLNEEAQQQIRSARLLLREFDIIRAVPDARHDLLSDRRAGEAYATQIPGEAYAVYFPDGGDVRLQLPAASQYVLKWLDLGQARWTADATVTGGRPLRLTPPTAGHWVALVKKVDRPISNLRTSAALLS